MTQSRLALSAIVALLAVWLLLNESLSASHLFLGTLFGILGAWLLTLLQVPRHRLNYSFTILTLAWIVLADIVRSNIAVARIVLGLATASSSGFVQIPLRLKNPYGLAVLACIITATPGTVWGEFDSGKGLLVIHVLDLKSNEAWIDLIQNRYERLLLEIFE